MALAKSLANIELPQTRAGEPSFKVVDDFLPPHQFDSLNRDWLQFLEHCYQGHDGQVNPDMTRRDIQIGDHDFRNLLKVSPSWRKFFEELSDKTAFWHFWHKNRDVAILKGLCVKEPVRFDPFWSDFWRFSRTLKHRVIRKIIHKTDLDLRYYKFLSKVRAGTAFYPMMSLALSQSGYEVSIHTDNRYKVFVALLYFDDVTSGGTTQFHKLNNAVSSQDCRRYPHLDQTTQFAEVTPRPNRAIVFLNSNEAYHSVTRFSNERRRFVYFGYAVKNLENVWETSYPVIRGTI